MILCMGATPAVQRVMVFSSVTIDGVNRALRTTDGLGGKALNVARVLQQLGETAVALGFAGGRRGQWMRDQIHAAGLECGMIEVEPETRLCTTLIDQGAGTITELVEESAAVMPGDYEKLFSKLQDGLPQAQAAVLSGTLTPGAPADFYRRCVAAARQAGVLCVLDAQGPPLSMAIEARPDVIKPNRKELEKTLGRRLQTQEEVWDGMAELVKRGAGAVIVTDGPSTILACSAEKRWKITPPEITAVNPIGSGDAFTAGLTASLAAGRGLDEACRAGAAAGVANALTLMPGTIDPEEFKRLFLRVEAKIL